MARVNPVRMNLNRLEWIALTNEDPVDPHRRIIDPHHHLWRDRGDMGTYLVDDLLRDTSAGHNVTDTVFVECGVSYRDTGPEALRPVGETEFVAAHAQASEQRRGTRISAIVAFADLSIGDEVDSVLQAHEEAGDGRLRGVRHRNVSSPPHGHPRLIEQAGFRRGVALVGLRGLSLDAWLHHPQLGDLADVAKAAESTTIVVDHLGGPRYGSAGACRAEIRAQWRPGMRGLASCPNVVVKLGGIGMEVEFGTPWSSRPQPPGSDEVAAWWRDDICWVIDTFGPSRCMFESNYPVDRQALGYTVLWNAFQKIAAVYADDEQDALFAGTAGRVYRIS